MTTYLVSISYFRANTHIHHQKIKYAKDLVQLKAEMAMEIQQKGFIETIRDSYRQHRVRVWVSQTQRPGRPTRFRGLVEHIFHPREFESDTYRTGGDNWLGIKSKK